jgi:hypothetical protein
VKRAYLIGLMVLVGLATVFTVGAVVMSGHRNPEMGLASAMGLGYLLVMSFAAFTAFERGWWRLPAFLGAGLAAAMMVVLPLYMYMESTISYSARPPWMETMGNLVIEGLLTTGLLCLGACVLSVPINLAGRMVQILTGLSYAGLFVLFQLSLWEVGARRDRFIWMSSFFILSGAGTITVFVLHKFFGIKVPNPIGLVVERMFLRCPRCQKEQDLDLASGRCAFCKLKIKVEVEEPVCPGCGYNLHQLTHAVCPECGRGLLSDEVAGEGTANLMKWAQANDVQRG